MLQERKAIRQANRSRSKIFFVFWIKKMAKLLHKSMLGHVNYPSLALHDRWQQGNRQIDGHRCGRNSGRINDPTSFVSMDHARLSCLWLLVSFQSSSELSIRNNQQINAAKAMQPKRQDSSLWKTAAKSMRKCQDWAFASSNSTLVCVAWSALVNQLCWVVEPASAWCWRVSAWNVCLFSSLKICCWFSDTRQDGQA